MLGVLGSDLVFASGTLFVAAIVHPHEQSLAGALFQTMAGVSVSILDYGSMIYSCAFRSGPPSV